MKKTTRRNFILGSVGVFGLGGAGLWFGKNSILRFLISFVSADTSALTEAPAIGGPDCVLTASQTEGPFFIASPMRADIREDREGKELKLRMQVVDPEGCVPVAGAVVELWHCDAEGRYSGYPEELAHDPFGSLMFAGTGSDHIKPVTDKRYLRGAQKTDAEGNVEFTTIFPGWYEPRSPHIHFKILTDDRSRLASQFYFDPELCKKVFTSQQPYTKYGDSPYNPSNDIVMSETPEAKGLMLRPKWNENGPIEVSARIGIKKV
ncbi:MAG: protocatechuate dioxygenase [Acidobacteriota bacterium]|nr:MAG: protocatechuate dioxygenase [Acidobacteriota bacterium]